MGIRGSTWSRVLKTLLAGAPGGVRLGSGLDVWAVSEVVVTRRREREQRWEKVRFFMG
jgi:hypothetical protein